MTVTLDVYTPGTPLAVGSLQPAPGAKFRERVADDGVATRRGDDGTADGIVILGDAAAALLAEGTYIRINEDGTDRFAFVPTDVVREAIDATGTPRTLVKLQGPGVRWWLHHGDVRQEDTSDCAPESDVRHIGWMSGAYAPQAALWDDAVEYGSWRDQADFFTVPPVRAAGLAAPLAKFITSATGPIANGDLYFFKQFTVAEDTTAVAQFAGDDEYQLMLSGTELLSTIGGGPYQWTDVQTSAPFRLCTGVTYTLAGKVRNTGGNVAGDNPAWLIGAIMPSAGDGKPASANHIVEISNDAEDGTITVQSLVAEWSTPVVLNHDDSGTEVQTALEAVFGVGNVTVSGAGTASKNEAYHTWSDAIAGTFTFTIGASTTNGIAFDAAAATLKTEIEAILAAEGFTGDATVTVVGSGTVADPWETNFSGDAVKEQAITMSADFTLLIGQTVAEHENIQDGAPLDPWVIEFVGLLANLNMLLKVTSSLSGGTVTENTVQVGGGAKVIVQTDDSWKVLAFPATPPGLNPQVMVSTLLAEIQARGVTVLDHFTVGGSSTVDSEGVAWGVEMNLRVSLPADLHRVCEMIEELGVDVWVDPELTIELAQERGDTTAHTLTAHTVNCANVKAGEDRGVVKNVIRVLTDEGWVELPDTASVTARGRIESGTRLGVLVSKAEVEELGQPILEDIATPPKVTRWKVPASADVTIRPLTDYGVGDRVIGPTWATSGFGSATLRVDTIEATLTDTGKFEFDVESVD